MAAKSIKLYWNEKAIGNGAVLTVLFGERQDTLDTAKTLIARMKKLGISRAAALGSFQHPIPNYKPGDQHLLTPSPKRRPRDARL